MNESLVREIEGLRSLLYSEQDPEGRAFVPLADALRRGHDLERALQVIEEGLARHPSLASAHVVLAWIQRDRGDRESAMAAWTRALELDAENVEALRGLGTLLLDSGRADEARPYLEKVTALDPEVDPPADGLPRIEGEAIELTPPVEGPPTLEGPATIEGADTVEEASTHDESPLDEEGPARDEPPAVAAAAEALMGGSDVLEVWAEPTEATALVSGLDDDEGESPGELPATRTLAELFARQGLHARAAGIYERLIEEHPDDPTLRTRLAQLRVRERPWTSPAEPASDETESLAREMSEAPPPTLDSATPFAWAVEEDEEGTRPGDGPDAGGAPISDYFRRLLAWTPGRTVLEGEPEDEATSALEPEPPESAGASDTRASDAVPIESLAPDWVPIASLAPDDPLPGDPSLQF